MPPIGAASSSSGGRGSNGKGGRASGQLQWVKKGSTPNGSQQQTNGTSEAPKATAEMKPKLSAVVEKKGEPRDPEEAFPPLSPTTQEPDEGASWGGSPASANGASAGGNATAPTPAAENALPAEEEKEERTKLVARIEHAERRLVARQAAANRIRQDVQRLRAETVASQQAEKRFREEAAADRFRGGGQKEALRGRHAEIEEKLADYSRRTEEHKVREREWREEFVTLDRQQATAADQVEELRRKNASLKAVSSDQNAQLSKVEARVKRLEARRAELKSEAGILQQKLSKQLEAENPSARQPPPPPPEPKLPEANAEPSALDEEEQVEEQQDLNEPSGGSSPAVEEVKVQPAKAKAPARPAPKSSGKGSKKSASRKSSTPTQRTSQVARPAKPVSWADDPRTWQAATGGLMVVVAILLALQLSSYFARPEL
eukprot:gb/GFBE01026109.1/.p1 GENE.gb/GFBE01026109.1/~~gb/GFBE01026109.1/.p1  ORF type:complete len:431 (+),score=107.40 gb/GFBE01026109.1/:1-1293(+)